MISTAPTPSLSAVGDQFDRELAQALPPTAKLYLVGGAIRDQLLGRTVSERDWLIVGGEAQWLHERGFRAVGIDFPVFLHPHSHEEYALARTERKSARGHRGFHIHASPDVTLTQDLSRRDLTINALACDLSGEIHDPYGGLEDLRRRRLRHVSPAFVEDPLRVLRVARFAARYAALGFGVDVETLALMRTIVADGELATLAPERIWRETERALGEQSPVEYFRTLRACGALGALFPEIDQLYGVPQTSKWHPEVDTGLHNEMVLQQATELSADTQVRFAALCHDLGKGETRKQELPSHHGHEERGARLVKSLCQRLRSPKNFAQLAVQTARYHGHAHKVFELRDSTLLKTLLALDSLRKPARFEQFLLACTADARGRSGFFQQPYPQANYLRGAHAALQSAQREVGTYARRCAGDPKKIDQLHQNIEKIRLDHLKQYRYAHHPQCTAQQPAP